MYWYEGHFGSFYHDPTISKTVSIASQWVSSNCLKSCLKWNTMKGNISSTNVTLLIQNVKIKCNEYFLISFPTAWWNEVIPHDTQISLLSTTSHNFLVNVKNKNKSFPCVAKTLQGNAGIAMRWFWAEPLSILIFKSWQVCDWRG